MRDAGILQPAVDDFNRMTGEWERLNKTRPLQKPLPPSEKGKSPESKPQKLKDSVVKNLNLPKASDRIVWDSVLKGFGLRVTASGVKSFILNYRSHGKQRRYTIGRYPAWSVEAAGAEAARLSKQIGEGFDPMGERKQSRENDRLQPTVADLAQEYLEHHCTAHNQPGTLRNNRSLLDGIFLPRFGKMRLTDFRTRDLEKLKDDLKATPYRANRCLALVSHMFSKVLNAADTDKDWAKWKAWVDGNPAHGIPRYEEKERESWLSEEKMRAFVAALDSYAADNPSGANAIRLLMLTGSREGEVLKADWGEFDLERGLWTKPSHHTKQKKIEHVSLSDQAVEILRGMKPQRATGPLFPGRVKGARVTLRRPWVQVCKLAELCEVIERKGKRHTITRYKPTLRIHDLRHNYASYLVSNGQSLETVGRLLGHTQVSTTKRYSHLMDAPQKAATNLFGKIFAASKPTTEELHG